MCEASLGCGAGAAHRTDNHPAHGTSEAESLRDFGSERLHFHTLESATRGFRRCATGRFLWELAQFHRYVAGVAVAEDLQRDGSSGSALRYLVAQIAHVCDGLVIELHNRVAF